MHDVVMKCRTDLQFPQRVDVAPLLATLHLEPNTIFATQVHNQTELDIATPMWRDWVLVLSEVKTKVKTKVKVKVEVEVQDQVG